MHTASNIARITALAVGIAGALAWGQADAAAFQLKENSAKGLGRAFAGSTSAWGDASVVATNPASMRLLSGRQFQADVSAIAFSAELQDGYSAKYPTGAAIGGGNGGDAGMIAPVPASYFHLPFGENDNMHFGMSLTAPFGFKTEYDRTWAGRYHGVKTDLKAVDLSAAFSYDVNPYVSFGVGVFVEHLAIELSNAVDFGAIAYSATNGASAALGLYPGSADGFATIKGKNNAWGYVLGATFSVTEDTNIALSYRSKVDHEINDGKATFDVPGNVATVLQTQARGIFVNTGGKAELTLPASATLSVTHRVNDRWTVMGDVSRTAWAPSFDQVVVDFASNQPDNVLVFAYDDTTFASIGAEYKLSDTVTLRGGVAYDQTPTTDEHRDVRVPDVSRRWLSFGLGWTPSEKTEFNLGYTHLFTNEPAIDITSATRSTLKGRYDVRGDVLGASINYKF
jgi:long-chain fatty acid transport protein